MDDSQSSRWACPAPSLRDPTHVLLSHGEGGRHSRHLLRQHILPRLGMAITGSMPDAATLPPIAGQLAFTTDAYTVTPLFFPGGDIGSLAVYGTANDLAVSGAQPRYLSLSLILEEGLPLEVLQRVLDSVAAAARIADMQVVTGDTKVAPRGTADQIFVTTAGVGLLLATPPPGPQTLVPNDVLLVTGPIARHGMAVLAARERLGFTPEIQSDVACLWPAVQALFQAGVIPRAMRDATRGGVAAVLHEWAEAAGHSLLLDEPSVPLSDDVRGACELLGIDPLHVANEGTMLLAVRDTDAAHALAVLRNVAVSRHACAVGRVVPLAAAPVLVQGPTSHVRVLDEPTGSLLPRIC